MNDKFLFYVEFIDFLFSEIQRKWKQDRPQDFIVCDAIGEEYEKCNHTAYKWYMKVMNGTLPTNLYIHISDSVKYKHSMDVMINRRKELYESMINSNDIVIWCLEHILI